ncbi:MAG: hypothetical protein A2044_08425 [Candidatus Firestonebacteria bacterium GWA2_43_8]|nr:MAG: hypothetical protein A2044_08425 [Candidatus Firestonebacteria bacterium GWA2_43_8]
MKKIKHTGKRKSKPKKLKPKAKNYSLLIGLLICIALVFLALSVVVLKYSAGVEKIKAEQLAKLEKANTLRKNVEKSINAAKEEKKKEEERARVKKAFNLFKSTEKGSKPGLPKSAKEIVTEAPKITPERKDNTNEYFDLSEDADKSGTVKEKLLQALGMFYESKFEEVIKLCEEVLVIEPDNITALERMGSAYYKLGKKREAKSAWEKAYKLNPDNKNLKKFIDKIERELSK